MILPENAVIKRLTELTLTTPLAASRLSGTAIGLGPWESRQIGAVTVTAVPAQHGPDGTEHLTGLRDLLLDVTPGKAVRA